MNLMKTYQYPDLITFFNERKKLVSFLNRNFILDKGAKHEKVAQYFL